VSYILFDNSFNLVDFGFDQIDEGATTTHNLLQLKVKVQQAGYLYVFLSNENPTPKDIWFDDFNIRRTFVDVIHTTDYYGYGSEIKGTTFSKAGAYKNQFLYNGKEKQDELDLGWLDYGARMYMSDIARWGVIDPLAEKVLRYSPYAYV
jgi:RHS repeat-associated protein